LLVYALWAWHLNQNAIAPGFTPVSIREPALLLERFRERGEVWQKLPGAMFATLRHTFPVKFAGLLSFFVFLRRDRNPERRWFELSAVFFFLFYLACLVWMYFVSFSDYEARRLASFERYLSIPLGVLVYFGLWRGFVAGYRKIESRVQFDWVKPVRNVSVSVIFICLVVSSYRSRGSCPPMYQDADRLQGLIEERGLVRPKVLVISQGSNLSEKHVIRFLSIGPRSYRFDMDSSGVSFGPENDNVWRTVLTESAMRDKIASNDIVWMVRSDPWIDQILTKLPLASQWQGPFDDVFLIRKGEQFECVPKR
jgi:hypothetical protein